MSTGNGRTLGHDALRIIFEQERQAYGDATRRTVWASGGKDIEIPADIVTQAAERYATVKAFAEWAMDEFRRTHSTETNPPSAAAVREKGEGSN